ncbi:MAG TPA: hypothetical protein VEU62_20010 [Bryobacterales bacterium]|nr:hypothetical protein [Bryobacterales bacterium]
MPSPKMTIVMTTIALPRVLESYAENAARHGRLAHVEALVIGDRKTPAESAACLEDIRSRWGFRAEYIDVAAQQAWLARFPGLEEIIPYNSDNRRNAGFLMALDRGCDVLLSIDDDNYCTEDDFYAGHAVAGSRVSGPVVRSTNGWFNICTMMENDAGMLFYPRGFPAARRNGSPGIARETREVFIAANAGLWIEDPDIDAVTRLYREFKTTRLSAEPVILGPEANSPINTQNTAVCRQAVPAYYYVVMGDDLGGAKIDRYGDIWSGYFLKKCADHLGHFVMVGHPVARHIRNRHDLFVDLRQELYGMMLTDPLVEMLGSLTLAGGDYAAAYLDLSRKLEQAVEASQHPYITPEVRAYFRKICSNMRVWVDACRDLR